MRVARAFRRLNFRVRQSLYYDDPDEGKSREIDVVAETGIGFEDALVAFYYAVECKLSSNKPWLLFATGELADSATFALSNGIATSRLARDDLSLNLRDYLARHSSIFSKDRLSHGLTCAFTTGVDVPYRSLLTAIKAAQWLADRQSRKARVFAFAVPLVVIDTGLYEVFLNEDSEVNVKEVASGTVRLKSEVGGVASPWVKVLTSKALDTFVMVAADMAERAVNHCCELLGKGNSARQQS